MSQALPTVVIGAGIVGVSTALHLSMRGHNVILVDREEPGRETSFGNSGIIETSYVLPFDFPSLRRFPGILLDKDTSVRVHYPTLLTTLPWMASFFFQSSPSRRRKNGRSLRPLVEIALEEHVRLMQNTKAEKYLRSPGRIQLFRSEASFKGSSLEREVARELSVPFETFDAADFASIEPHIAPVFYRAVRWAESARVTDPGAVTLEYANRFARDGGTLHRGRVLALREQKDKTWQVIHDRGTICAARVVVCAGPWSTELLKPLGYKFPLGIKRGYHQHYSSQNGVVLNHAIADNQIGYLIVPTELGYRITTGAEYAGITARPTPVQIARVLPKARELFPLGEPVGPTWVGGRPCFADSLPVIGRAFKHRDLWLNFGHGHSGLTIGPSSARLLAEMIDAEVPFCDPSPYRPERFW